MDGRKGVNVALKILHTADWHLGLRFPAMTPEQEKRLTRARLEVVGRILDLAESRGVDAVLCAGDLFDEPRPDEEWWQGLAVRVPAEVVDAAGHPAAGKPRPVDAGTRSMHLEIRFRRGLPGYVHVVDSDEFELPLGSAAVVYARPCRSHAGQTGLAASLPARAVGDERNSHRAHSRTDLRP